MVVIDGVETDVREAAFGVITSSSNQLSCVACAIVAVEKPKNWSVFCLPALQLRALHVTKHSHETAIRFI